MISRRGKRNSRDESDLKFPAKSTRVSSEVALKDRDYIFPCKKSAFLQLKKNINTVKESVFVSCQTDIDQLEIMELVKNVARLKIAGKQSSSKQSQQQGSHETRIFHG